MYIINILNKLHHLRPVSTLLVLCNLQAVTLETTWHMNLRQSITGQLRKTHTAKVAKDK